jgi:hypothetical protein
MLIRPIKEGILSYLPTWLTASVPYEENGALHYLPFIFSGLGVPFALLAGVLWWRWWRVGLSPRALVYAQQATVIAIGLIGYAAFVRMFLFFDNGVPWD